MVGSWAVKGCAGGGGLPQGIHCLPEVRDPPLRDSPRPEVAVRTLAFETASPHQCGPWQREPSASLPPLRALVAFPRRYPAPVACGMAGAESTRCLAGRGGGGGAGRELSGAGMGLGGMGCGGDGMGRGSDGASHAAGWIGVVQDAEGWNGAFGSRSTRDRLTSPRSLRHVDRHARRHAQRHATPPTGRRALLGLSHRGERAAPTHPGAKAESHRLSPRPTQGHSGPLRAHSGPLRATQAHSLRFQLTRCLRFDPS